ncbi:MAG: hypothetical protein KIY12_00485 [Thermoplasmata archaeon]|uniref:Uncharacterized protein n=1 Tax=Candidatus Sysuiplasma superficiale TaxID=2823368 RepID=A0A8J7YQA2_9ARCH|nr:hypothetical protein [Candidatus Sysuiplasma superficiale]MBX8643201.1 hypothetical protein [Candidatus Sysuiplasma superficiale]MCL5437355.1 hypothetical protein [Candidatus Thermoplasmatota archaeon]
MHWTRAAAVVLLFVLLTAQLTGSVGATDVRVYVSTARNLAYWNSTTVDYINITYSQSNVQLRSAGSSFMFKGIVSGNGKGMAAQVTGIAKTLSAFNSTVTLHGYNVTVRIQGVATAEGIRVIAFTYLNMSVGWLTDGTVGEYNMSWKSLDYQGPVTVSGTNGTYVNADSPASFFSSIKWLSIFSGNYTRLAHYNTLNFTALSLQLSDWNRVYESSSGLTLYSFNPAACTCMNFTLAATYHNSTINCSASFQSDPSALIATTGRSYAIGNTIYTVQGSGSSIYNFAIASAVIAAVIFFMTALAVRRGRKRLK